MKEFYSCDKCNQQTLHSQKSCTRNTISSTKMLSLGYIIIGFLLITQCVAQDFKIDIENSLNSADKPVRTEPVALHWGIADTSAVVGKLFNYVIPSDAFKGEILDYQITQIGLDGLPAWLNFDSKNHQLKGIPSPSDVGQHYLEVVVKGHQNSIAKDVFSITVTGESPVLTFTPSAAQNGRPQVVRCRREVPETAVTIVVDTNLESLPALQRLDMVNSVASFLNLANDMMKLLPKGEKPMIDSSTIVAGAGNIKEPKHPGVQVSWLVGCGKVEDDHMSVLNQVEKAAKNGSLAQALGFPIAGWQITNTLFQEAPHRRRRAIRATATPVVTRGPPTKVTEVVTVTDQIKPSGTDEPMTRSVPIMSSPAIDIVPTKSIVAPPASPEPTDMMTKVVTAAPTPQPTPKPTTKKTEILPTKTHILTAAPPTDTKPSPSKPTTTASTQIDNVPRCPDGSVAAPVKVGGIRNLEFKAGELTQYKIPESLFYDCKDGSTSNLKLDLFIEETKVPPKNSWISILRKKGKWYITGAPLSNDVGMHKYRITAQNTIGMAPAFDDFSIMIEESDVQAVNTPSHELGLVLDEDFEQFTVANRMQLVKQIRRIYGDSNDDSISILRFEKGSVKFGWTNNSLPTDSCPIEGIKSVVNKLVDENGDLTERARNALGSYNVGKATAAPMGSCEGNPDFPYRNIDPSAPKNPTPKPTSKPSDPSGSKPSTVPPRKADQEEADDMLITTVVPAVVIVIILLIALLIACCLYRKRRKGKMSLEDKNTFVNKGAPIIFPDEYDEKPNDIKKPLIMEEEKPPMPPPEYTRASSESSRSSDKNHEPEEYEMDETDLTSPIIQPPPPIHSSGGNKQPRPHMQTPYNNKPYVPP